MTLRIIVCQAPLSMGFSRREYWGRSPCPPPGDLPGQGLNSRLLHTCIIPLQPHHSIPMGVQFERHFPDTLPFSLFYQAHHPSVSLIFLTFVSLSPSISSLPPLSLPFFYDQKNCLILWSAFHVQTPHKPGCVIGPSFLQRKSLFKSPVRLCPRFQGPG